MKRKTLFSMLGIALCSMGLTAQTYKLQDMTSAEFEAGGNQLFSFSEYRLASGTYSPLTVYSDSGRVNYFDIYLPECFQAQAIGTKSSSSVAAEKSWYEPLFMSLSNKKINLTIGRSNDASSFIYVGSINSGVYETYPTLLGTVALEFKAPADGYYKITSTAIRQDCRADIVGSDDYVMAKFRFRQNGDTWVDQSSTMGFDYKFGSLTDGTEFSYDKEAMGGNGPGIFTYYKTNPTPHTFYAYLKAGDIITAEADISHKYKTSSLFMDSTNYWARDAWGRTRWTQFDAEVVTKEVAEAQEDFVNPYEVSGDDYVQMLKDLVDECVIFMEGAVAGDGVGQFDQLDIDAINAIIDNYAVLANKDGLLSFTAKVYYGKLQKDFEAFKAKAHTIDFNLPENCWLFQIPETSSFYDGFVKQFKKEDPNSPWDFKTYTVSSGIYNAFTNFDTSNKSGVLGYYDNGNDWFYIAQNAEVHPLTTKSPVITFKAAADGLYHASTTVQRNLGNKNKNEMYTRYRFVKDGIEDGITSVDKESFMFADAYGHADNNVPVSRDFYVKMKAGDVITFEEDCYTANTNGSGGTIWQKLMVLKVPADQEESTIEANKDSYFDAYAKADNFKQLDSVINVVGEKLATMQFTDDPNEVGKYPTASKYEVDDALDAAKELNRAEATQYEVDKTTRDLSAAFAKLLTTLQVRYEKEETLASGPYYIEKDGLFLTTDTCWGTGLAEQVNMFAHLQPLSDPTKVKNNQVFDIQFNAEAGNEDPLRYTLQCVLKNETWTDGPAYHVTETGQVREGDKSVAQGTVSDNNKWRNHSLIYDGTRWCIYNVQKKTSLIFDTDLTKRPATSGDKLYLYRLIPMDKIDDYRGVEEVNASATTAQIVAIAGEGSAELYATQEMEVVIYNGASESIATVSLSTSATRVNLPAGFYIVKAMNGAATKMIVK